MQRGALGLKRAPAAPEKRCKGTDSNSSNCSKETTNNNNGTSKSCSGNASSYSNSWGTKSIKTNQFSEAYWR